MNRFFLAAAGLSLTLFAQGNAWAQTADEASVRKLLQVTEAKKLVDGMYAQLDQVFESSLRQSLGGTELTPGQLQIAQQAQAEIVGLIKSEMGWDRLEPSMIEIYQKNFTEAEVQGMLQFYESDVGRSMIAKMPAVMASSMQVTQQRMVEIAPKLQEVQRKTTERLQELCKKEPANCPKQ